LGKIEEPGKKFSAKSADALILEFEKRLLGVLAPEKDAAHDLDSEEEVQGPEKRRKKNVRDPLFSFKILAERPEMLEFYTGYDGKRILMLTDRLAQVHISLSLKKKIEVKRERPVDIETKWDNEIEDEEKYEVAGSEVSIGDFGGSGSGFPDLSFLKSLSSGGVQIQNLNSIVTQGAQGRNRVNMTNGKGGSAIPKNKKHKK
jgi:hypothetical protein